MKQFINTFKARILLIVIIFLLSLVQLVLLNTYSTKGNDLSKLMQDIEKVQSDNVALMQKIASVSSISVISKRAEKLNINKNIPLFFFTTPLPVAYNMESSM